jgi:Ca2+-binding RTX toxin-like protein
MATLTVGSGQQYSTISAAVAASHDGDVIQVQAGTYTNDFASISKDITLQGVGGMVKLVATQNIPNGKAILIANGDITIDNFEFTGAKVGDQNGAGIRYEGGNLTITDSYFHDNQNGLLAATANGTITIRNSEFDHNGTGDGRTHNIYVNGVSKLTIDNSLFHDAVIGHQIKSRAVETVITNSRIYDESGTSSYSIDLPNGGKATITGNVIQQGPNGDNPAIIAYGEEGLQDGVNSATISNNIVLNDMGRGAFVWDASGSPIAVSGTQTWHVDTMFSGDGVTVSGTTQLASEPALDLTSPWGGSSTPAPVPTTPQSLTGGAGADTLTGGTAADTLSGGDGANFMRGGEGADVITGGSGFDNINGNQGADTINSGAGGDWALGGQGEDVVSAGDGADIVNGNIGQDTVDGGNGADTVRGGQGDDVITGGAGDDWISGDLGSDTITGGTGADIFHGFAGAGVDRITDFNYAEGDRVVLDHGTTYSAAQVGADVVITMTGATMTLANVTLTSLPSGWITVA